MLFNETPIAGVWVIDPQPIKDDRGWFARVWCAREFGQQGTNFIPVQANMGKSLRKGTIRGMHFQQAPDDEAKLVRCMKGSMFDVALDLRPQSPTYCCWYGVELSEKNGRMLYIPEHCAHGYQTLEDDVEMHYMTSAFYAPSSAHGVRYDDPVFDIKWPLPATAVSEQDLRWPLIQR